MIRPKAPSVLRAALRASISASRPAFPILRYALGCALLTGVSGLAVQPAMASEVVQALPDPNTARLGDALTRLARDQNDLEALLDAGNAARELGDFDAAKGFFERAQEVAPRDGRIAEGLARTTLRAGDPVGAITYFENARKAGRPIAALASDQALAYDMVGDTLAAQALYRRVLSGGALTSDEESLVRRRLAVSQAISGDLEGSEDTLMPLLRAQDKPGWRTRAFTLAIAGETKEAVKLAERILPAPLAEDVAPYLRYMPRLTAAQQAAAANLGRFPRASEIGRDSARIAAYEPAQPIVPAATAGSGAPAVSTAKPVGAAEAQAPSRPARRARRSLRLGERNFDEPAPRESARRPVRKPEAEAEVERVAPPEPKPGIEVVPGDGGPVLGANGELPPVSATASAAARDRIARAAPTPAPLQPAGPMAAPAAAASSASVPASPATATPAVAATASPASGGSIPSRSTVPGFDLARASQVGASQAGAPPTRSGEGPSSAAEEAVAQMSLSEAFADLGKPRSPDTPVSGAVDIRKVTPARPAPPPPPPKPKKPAHPSRIWVQIGVGRDTDAIAFDWRRYTRRNPALFKGQDAHITDMGRTHRILVGPFATRKAADGFVEDFAEAGNGRALVWTSPAGQVVDALDAGG
ncbi:tetratricopeptide repeat protein [Novosphingobium mangrovi (ex Hu et al. 2023)]|uniref:Tetratricopeptide repeat protein n=1 Tax=Novosphingobium mangrovi (ex Hu et al. 2023) TaxID=2930094 RepID=A0ABT0A8E8_9SPHN|nr:SPOR domain-containing protein [Novosphingobium mangrovi (ex Hu et al. 2023)]MCJ1959452.1 tetratricopeptide repeat protein [Novosphingobium mangrovi (ex Hu et al. 2023)]